MLAVYGVIVTVPSLRAAFELTPLRGTDFAAISGAVALWAVALRFVWRRYLFERWLGVNVR